MSTSSYKLNGTAIKRPDDFKIDSFKITKASRLADGSMSMQFIARKLKFYLTYDKLDSVNLTTILNIIDGNAVTFTFTYMDNNVLQTKTVYVGPISRILLRTGAVWWWKTVTFDLIEV